MNRLGQNRPFMMGLLQMLTVPMMKWVNRWSIGSD